MDAKNTASIPNTDGVSNIPLIGARQIMAPITIIPEIALVTDIRGVCSAGVTFQIIMYPMTMARIKAINNYMKRLVLENAIRRNSRHSSAIQRIQLKLSQQSLSTSAGSIFEISESYLLECEADGLEADAGGGRFCGGTQVISPSLIMVI